MLSLTTLADIVFAAGVVLVAGALAGAAFHAVRSWLLVAVASLESAAAVAAWVGFALRHDRGVAVAAGGLTACALAATAAVLLARALARTADRDGHLAAAEQRLREFVEREAAERAAELERALARARADSVSLLVEEERKIAEERRRVFAEREREAGASLTESLTQIQSQVEQRLAGWAQDLDRAAEATKRRIAELSQRQQQLLADVEHQIVADAERLAADSDEQRAAIGRLRTDIDKSLEEVLSHAHAEVEAHAAERRRALHEIEERARRRERELLERIEHEEGEAVARIRTGFQDVERRQLEQMERLVERAVAGHSDEAAQQFSTIVKSSREDAARRLARELDRSVEVFAREAESVLAERLAHVGDAGAQRLERRLTEATKGLERQGDDWMVGLDRRVAELEADVRRRLEELTADAEAERAVLEARLQELVRRFDAASTLRGPS